MKDRQEHKSQLQDMNIYLGMNKDDKKISFY